MDFEREPDTENLSKYLQTEGRPGVDANTLIIVKPLGLKKGA